LLKRLLLTCSAILIAIGVACGAQTRAGDTTHAGAVWRGDYTTGNFSQWTAQQSACTGGGPEVGSSCASIVSSPVRAGAYAAEFQTPSYPGPERAEVSASVSQTGGYEGQEQYYAWSTMFPAAGNQQGFWSVGGDWNNFTQWHNANNSCGNNIQFGVDSTRGTNLLYSDLTRRQPGDCEGDVRAVHAVLGRLRFDAWYDFIARIKWSTNPSVGFYEAWMNGIQVVRKTFGPTMWDSQGAYWKQGFYRGAFPAANTVYEAGAVRGTSLAAVTGNFRLSLTAPPTLTARNELVISARSFAQDIVLLVVRDQRGRIVGSRRASSDGAGHVRATVPIRRPPASRRLRVTLRALVSPRLPLSVRLAQVVVTLPR
jgi:hypothetical protein